MKKNIGYTLFNNNDGVVAYAEQLKDRQLKDYINEKSVDDKALIPDDIKNANGVFQSVINKLLIDFYLQEQNNDYFTKDLGYMGTTMSAGETECAKAEYSGNSKIAWLLFTYGSTDAINTAMTHQEHGETTTKQTIFAGSNVSSRTITFTDSHRTVVESVGSWSRETSLFGVQTTDISIVLRMLNPLLKSSRGLYQLTLPAATTSRAGMMSAADKTKLDGIEASAQKNVQANWNQTDSSADDYIKNKPTYLSKESAENMLNAMVSAGVIASYTMTYDTANARYQFTIVAPSQSNE